MIDYELKAKCVSLMGKMAEKDIYEKVFLPEHSGMGYKCFRAKLRYWKKKQVADEDTLAAGTYPEFTAHSATVQVDRYGQVTQAWIKQQKEGADWNRIAKFITEDAPRSSIIPSTLGGDTMLEIPLNDMHFGVATIETYKTALAELLGIISAKQYDEINILIGQDLLHNNDLRGHTAKGTQIEQIDFTQAWKDAWVFYRTLIDMSLKHSHKVRILYSRGNHDECSAWCFFKALEAVYPQVESDDSLAARKCIVWRGCFIGYGHCEYTSKNYELFQDFVLDFPEEFSKCKVREIHAGHLHREGEDYGIMIRRLPSAVPTDKWSSDNGYVGSHKRFMIFEWAEGRLKGTFYI